MKNTATSFSETDAIASRYALRVTALLSESGVSHDVSERLRVAREQAVQRAAATRRTAALAHKSAPTQEARISVNVGGGSAAWGGGSPLQPSQRWTGWMPVVPVLAMLVGLWLIDHHWSQRQIEAAAEVDAALLADDLPPTAYSDAGFVEYLKAPRP